ncbi:hypothetical protein Tfu_1127 [Thermobifida fusca YX]|nr:hypothetical protein Tfu_1127 [Thermobifida fusca YX]
MRLSPGQPAPRSARPALTCPPRWLQGTTPCAAPDQWRNRTHGPRHRPLRRGVRDPVRRAAGRPGAHCRPPGPHGPGPRQRTLLPADQPRRHRPLPGGRRPLGLRHPAPAGRPRPAHRPARGARMTPTPKTPDGQETDEVYRVRGQRVWRDGAELSTRRIEALAARLAAVARARREAELRAAYPVGTRVWLRGDPTPRTVTGYTDSPGLPPSLRLSGHTIARPRQVTRNPPT